VKDEAPTESNRVLLYVFGFVAFLITVPAVIAYTFYNNKGSVKQKELRYQNHSITHTFIHSCTINIVVKKSKKSFA